VSGRFFDTNVLVYAQEASAKGDIARALLADGGGVSVQSLNEFANVALKKLGRAWPEIEEAIADLLALLTRPVALTLTLHEAARRLAAAHRLQLYDALIIAAALETGATTLLSEDLQAGRSFGALTIVNPFAG
jgi:predicted nucleic acid-binding protein